MAIAATKKTGLIEKSKGVSPETKKNIETHKKAALHYEAAAKFHREAAKFHEEGNHDKAHQSSIIASGHSYEAHDLHKEEMKHHALSK